MKMAHKENVGIITFSDDFKEINNPLENVISPDITRLLGREGKGGEGKGREGKERERGRFAPPQLDEILNYCKERGNGWPSSKAERFFDFYAVAGWKKANGQLVKNWKQCVITWEGKDGIVSDKLEQKTSSPISEAIFEKAKKEIK